MAAIAPAYEKKPFVSSILLWMRTDKLRQQGMDHWKGPHAGWYEVVGPGDKVGARSLIYLRRREGVKTGPFRTFLNHELVPALVRTGAIRELRTQVFMPWIERLWDTPNVAHDNPTDQRFQASLVLGFRDADTMSAFFAGDDISGLSATLPDYVSAVHAYEVTEALTFVKGGKILPHYQA